MPCPISLISHFQSPFHLHHIEKPSKHVYHDHHCPTSIPNNYPASFHTPSRARNVPTASSYFTPRTIPAPTYPINNAMPTASGPAPEKELAHRTQSSNDSSDSDELEYDEYPEYAEGTEEQEECMLDEELLWTSRTVASRVKNAPRLAVSQCPCRPR